MLLQRKELPPIADDRHPLKHYNLSVV